MIKLAKETKRYIVLNSNESQLPILPRGDRDAMEEFIENLKILLGVLGYKALYPLTKIKKPLPSHEAEKQDKLEGENQIELTLNSKNIRAKSYLTDEGIVVLAGSQASKDIKESLSPGYKKFRDTLIKNGVLIETKSGLEFSKDQLFKSPSQAAAIIVGYPINGRFYWKTKDGKALKEIEENYN